MIRNRRFITTGIFSVFLYISLIITIFLYLNHKNSKLKPKIYVPKVDNSISVSLNTPIVKKMNIQKKKEELLKENAIKRERQKESRRKKARELKKREEKKRKKAKIKKEKERLKKKRLKAKKLREKKLKEKKALKRKKELQKKKRELEKKIKTKNLFKNLKTKKPKENHLKISDKKSNSKQDNKAKGIKNAYIAKITETLTTGFPEQSSFAGEEITIRLMIDPSGDFIFKILKYSNNEEFNESMRRYLEQLQSIGLGKHKNRGAYKFNIIFVAKD